MKKTLTGPGCFRLILALVVFTSHESREAVGTAAVDVFFALSGYWIFRMYEQKYSKTISPYFTYLTSRMWRLLPTFLLLNTAAVLIDVFYLKVNLLPGGWLADFHAVFSNLFILGYSSMSYLPLVTAWSLDMEVQFYLIAPILIWLVKKRPRTVLAAAACISLFFNFYPIPILTGIFVFFVIGLSAAALSWKPSPRLVIASLILLILVFTLTLLSPWRYVIYMQTPPNPMQNYNDAMNALFALIAMPIAFYTTSRKGGRHDSTLGELSYIVYLLHWPFVVLFPPRESTFVERAIERLAIVIVVLALSYLILKAFDKPLNQMRTRWVNRRILQQTTG
jgi:peptidoglycan/LPS O-acetylase OafA/YrhL